jgi:hypothetical protein
MQARDDRGTIVDFFPEQAQGIELVLRVEVICRFVEQVDVRLLCKYLRNCESPPLSARQSQHVTASQSPEVDGRERRTTDIEVLGRLPLEASNVWMTAYHGGIEYRCREYIVDMLRQQGELSRNVSPVTGGDVLAVQQDLSP